MMLMSRKRFAWMPTRLYRLNGHFVEKTKNWIWLKEVRETHTMWGTWVAYIQHQKEIKSA